MRQIFQACRCKRPVAVAFALLLASCHTSLPQARKPSVQPLVEKTTVPPEGPLGTDVVPLAYDLQLFLDPNQASFSGIAKISLQIDAATQRLFLHGQDLEVTQAIVWDGQQQAHHVRYTQVTRQGVARLDIDPPLEIGPASLQIQYQAQYNKALSGLYRVHDRDQNYVFSQFEPLSARLAFPCFDEPRFKTPFDVTLVVPQDMTAISNTNAVAESLDDQGHKSIRFGQTEALPTYLLAMVVGTLEHVQSYVPINVYRQSPLPLRAICTKAIKTNYIMLSSMQDRS